ncbi:unnamed protein product [Pleuronectes platessa]|uniref:Uncharacterized protein n=1 Tax=Pleuronectes platessa TaxID=8262 RepID=A0A9N7YZU0_PLEPL|nr:unnamed protein product [Pleuronectes platessa]
MNRKVRGTKKQRLRVERWPEARLQACPIPPPSILPDGSWTEKRGVLAEGIWDGWGAVVVGDDRGAQPGPEDCSNVWAVGVGLMSCSMTSVTPQDRLRETEGGKQEDRASRQQRLRVHREEERWEKKPSPTTRIKSSSSLYAKPPNPSRLRETPSANCPHLAESSQQTAASL